MSLRVECSMRKVADLRKRKTRKKQHRMSWEKCVTHWHKVIGKVRAFGCQRGVGDVLGNAVIAIAHRVGRGDMWRGIYGTFLLLDFKTELI